MNSLGKEFKAFAFAVKPERATSEDESVRKEKFLADAEAAAELGLDLWDNEEFADKSENEFNELEEEIKLARKMYLENNDDDEELTNLLEEIEKYHSTNDEGKKFDAAKGRAYINNLISRAGLTRFM